MQAFLKSLRWTWPLAVVALLVLVPYGCHWAKPRRSLSIVVVDKTVPFQDRREHRSLFWLLDHLKIRRSDGAPYDRDADYLGAFPGPEPGDPPRLTAELVPLEGARADILYFADTYGVYEKDLESGRRMTAALERSRKIYGGLEPSEARVAAEVLADGKLLAVEFNTLASPTGGEARRVMEEALGVRWTRWVGRFFARLDDKNEIPPWMRDNYERIHHRRWDLRGPGYVLIQDDARILVLRPRRETRRIGLTIERERPIDPLLAGARDRIPYPYWFDVVEAAEGVQVLASYAWQLTDEGAARLDEQGLPRRFPAVTRRLAPGGGTAYYFAGDFADNPITDQRMPFAGYAAFKRWFEGGKLAPSDTAFFWRFYVPMMRELLEPLAVEWPDD